jgi:glucokinase
MSVVVGVDLGGTNVRVGLIDAGRVAVLGEERLSSHVAKGPRQLVRRVAKAAAALAQASGQAPVAVGVGVAGLIDAAAGTVLFSPNFPGWKDFALGPELARATGLPVAVDNDANMAALGEQQAGAAKGLGFLACLTLGTGVGGGFIFGGRLYRGATGQAGEVGHLKVERPGALCGCGHRGCLETIASATGLTRMAREGLARGRKTTLSEATGLDARAIAAAAEAGDRFAKGLYGRAGRALGFGLAQLFNLLDIEAAVLTGGVSAAWPLFIASLETTLQASLLPRKQARVLRGRLGDTGGMIGAGCLALALAGGQRPKRARKR